MALTDKLTNIADAIRGKTGKEELLTLDQMATEIADIETGGTDQSVGLINGTLTEYESAEVTGLRTYAFYYLSSLKKVVLPDMTNSANTNAFRYCTALELFDAPCYFIQSAAFANCGALKTLVLRKTEGVCGMANVNALTATPFASGGTGGTVYVPGALIDEYKNATNWSTLYAAGTCNFVALEGSEYE